MPTFLAGRDEDIQNIEQMFEALTMNIPVQSIIYSGLRGVGKTVLINCLQKIAENKGIFCKHIEVETLKHLVKKSLDAIKSLVVSFDPNGNTFSLSVQDRELYQTNNLTQSLTDVFTSIGETAAPDCLKYTKCCLMRRHIRRDYSSTKK